MAGLFVFGTLIVASLFGPPDEPTWGRLLFDTQSYIDFSPRKTG